jgi:hypothetical protein
MEKKEREIKPGGQIGSAAPAHCRKQKQQRHEMTQ